MTIHSHAAMRAAVETLERQGYTYLEGAQFWKPPIHRANAVVWHQGSQAFYQAQLLYQLKADEVFTMGYDDVHERPTVKKRGWFERLWSRA